MSGLDIISILIFLTALSSYINYKYIKLPKSIGITSITLFLSFIVVLYNKMGFELDYGIFQNIKFNETFLNGMLSFLLFAGSLHINIVELSRYKILIILLATFSVFFSTIFIGFILYTVLQILCINLPFYYCFVFGALISPTDPIAVLGVLKIVKAPRSLELKIAGEALFNDGTGIVLFFIFLGLSYGENISFSFVSTIFYFVRQTIGGFILGLILGFISAKLLRNINDSDIAIIFTLGMVSSGYYLSHSILEVSGPICMAIAGLVISNFIRNGYITEETNIRLVSFWELLDEVLNSVLFVLIGLEFIEIQFDFYVILIAIITIIIVLFSRWVSLLIPILSITQFKIINISLLNVLTWGGLRGGISIALALSIEGFYHNFLVAITYSVVIFSMLVQGFTVNYLIKDHLLKKKY